MIVCIPVTSQGDVDPSWGRADRVAIAELSAGSVASWHEFEVGWGRLHDSGPEGSHHGRIARFLREHKVGVVVAGHMGPPMAHMLEKMEVDVQLGAHGPAREAVVRALSVDPPRPG